MKLLQFTVPGVSRVHPRTMEGYLTAAPQDPIPLQVSYNSGAYLVASLVDGDDYDAAEENAILVEETGRLPCNSGWTRDVMRLQRVWNATPRSERDYRYGAAPFGLTHESRVDRYWIDEIALLHRDGRIILDGECDELEKELTTKMHGEFCRVLWHAWKFLVTTRMTREERHG